MGRSSDDRRSLRMHVIGRHAGCHGGHAVDGAKPNASCSGTSSPHQRTRRPHPLKLPYPRAKLPAPFIKTRCIRWLWCALRSTTGLRPSVPRCAVGMQRAREACDAAKPDDYRGEDLYDLARLCSFGQDWSPANDAAQKYMASKAQAHETQAMAISVRALAHIGSIDLAVITTYGLLHFPYDADVAHTVRFMKDTLEHAGSPVALTVAGEEHAAVVNALSQPGPLTAAGSDAAISTGALYASAMDLAFLNRFAGNTDAAAAAAADADAALQKLTAIPAEDQQEIDEVRAQYHLLGMHLPNVHPTRTLQSASAKPRDRSQFRQSHGARALLRLVHRVPRTGEDHDEVRLGQQQCTNPRLRAALP